VGLSSLLGCAPNASTKAWYYEMELGGVGVHVEVARTESQRNRGLMGRDRLQPDWGMLFVFPREETQRFWMKNTKIPLSIAFLDDGLVVRDIQDMEPFDLTPHVSRSPARYALEMEQGWFARRNVVPGTVANFSPELDEFIGRKK
jgi:uncharacterized protein